MIKDACFVPISTRIFNEPKSLSASSGALHEAELERTFQLFKRQLQFHFAENYEEKYSIEDNLHEPEGHEISLMQLTPVTY